MMNAPLVLRSADQPTARQQSLRDRSCHLPLRKAVRVTASVFFRFRCRAAKVAALWSGTERVWLGRKTFLEWALWETRIDIPWVVARAADAPEDPDELRAAVQRELVVYWERQMSSLPRSGKPRWLPLP